MYVYEELVNGRKLTEIINEEHENVKYLPGFKFTPNVVSFLYFQLINSNTILI
jgi:glycerol-3-phosphate dehydrogenase (NAD+)